MSEMPQAGQWAEVAEGVRRLTAPNPSMMTGPGTNSYVIGEHRLAVIDPGPVIESHLRMLADAGDVRWIIATHTHPDHSPGAAMLKELTGAELVGLGPPAGPHQDATFAPQHEPANGEVLDIDGDSLKLIHTPGHASNHVCVLHEAHKMLFTGDHIMGGSTVVIDPPDGDMGAYLRSLAELRELDLASIAPGHGPVLTDPGAVIDALIAHRLGRESKVRNALLANPGVDSMGLVPAVYVDVDERLYTLAERSLLAHLLKLRDDGEAELRDDRWWPLAADDQA